MRFTRKVPISILGRSMHLLFYWGKDISFKTEKYIRLELTQQSLLTSHVSAPFVVSKVESRWTYCGRSIEWIFWQFWTFDTGEVWKGFRACDSFCSVRSSHALYARKVPSSILGRSMHSLFYLQRMKRPKFRNGQNSCFTRQVSLV
jgi:hypothetical protein